MRRAAKQEIRLLQKLNHAHIISLLLPTARVGKTSGKSSSTNDGDGDISSMMLAHRGQVCMVFPFEFYNFRHILVRFGKDVGITLSAVRS